jgi:hypothetical protein
MKSLLVFALILCVITRVMAQGGVRNSRTHYQRRIDSRVHDSASARDAQVDAAAAEAAAYLRSERSGTEVRGGSHARVKQKSKPENAGGRLDSAIEKQIGDWVARKPNPNAGRDEDDEEEEIGQYRTATGGIINTMMIFLTFVAFIGNGACLWHVFFMKDLAHSTNQSHPVSSKVTARGTKI